MIGFTESNFYKALQDFFINNNKDTFLEMLSEFYNRTENIIEKNEIQDDIIKELRELFIKFNEDGIDENIVKGKVNDFIENSGKIQNIISKLARNTNNIENIKSELDTKANLNSVFGMTNMGQDVREAMTGGSVAVVGKNAVLRDNIVDGQITFEKLDPVIKNEYEEIYNSESLTVNNGYLSYTGVSTDDQGWKHWSCNAIPNYKYKVSGQSWLSIPVVLFMNSNNEVISYYPTTQDNSVTNYTNVEVIAPINASKIVVNRMLTREFGIKRRIKIELKPRVKNKVHKQQ